MASTMKIITFSRGNKGVKVKYASGKSKWFYFTSKTREYASRLKKGDSITGKVANKGGKSYLTFFKKVGGSSSDYKGGGGNGGDMTKMNVLKSVCQAMTGNLKTTKELALIKKAYDTLLEVVVGKPKDDLDEDIENEDIDDTDDDIDEGDEDENGDEDEIEI